MKMKKKKGLYAIIVLVTFFFSMINISIDYVKATDSYDYLKTNYPVFINQLVAGGATEQNIKNFIDDLQRALRRELETEKGTINESVINEAMKKALKNIAFSHTDVLTAFTNSYPNMYQELSAGIIPNELEPMYESLRQYILNDLTIDDGDVKPADNKGKNDSKSDEENNKDSNKSNSSAGGTPPATVSEALAGIEQEIPLTDRIAVMHSSGNRNLTVDMIPGDDRRYAARILYQDLKTIADELKVNMVMMSEWADLHIPRQLLAGLFTGASEGDDLVVSLVRVGSNSLHTSFFLGEKKVASFPDAGAEHFMVLRIKLDALLENDSAMDYAHYVPVLESNNGPGMILKKSYPADHIMYTLLPGFGTISLKENDKSFADVSTDFWGRSAVEFVTAREIFHGTGADTFSPQLPVSRAMMATILYNLEDNPYVTPGNNFPDVDREAWYATAVNWAAANGLAAGTGTGFAPDQPISREQLMVLFFRYAEFLQLNTDARGDLSIFEDAREVSSWAEEAARWAYGTGLVTGKSDYKLEPAGTATRAEVAAITQKFIAALLNNQ